MAQFTVEQALAAGLQHHQAGQLQQAEALYRRVLSQQPNHAEALHYLGVLAGQVGRNDSAVDLIRRAIASKPGYPEAHNNLGNILQALGRFDEAIATYHQAIVHHSNYAEAYYNLGNALEARGRLSEAIAAYRQAIDLKQNYPEAYSNLGNALTVNGQLGEAIAAFRQAIALKPTYVEGHNNLGNALKDKGQLDEAIAAFHQAIALNPSYAEPYCNLGAALHTQGRLDESIAACRAAIALKHDFPLAHNNLGISMEATGQHDEAIAAYRQAIALEPNSQLSHSNLVLALHYHPGYDASAIAGEHRRWNQQHAEPLKQFIQPHPNDRDPDRRLRIGYVSPDFRDHVVGRFMLPLLTNHDRRQVEVFAYSQTPVHDTITERLRANADGWRRLFGLSDAQAADLIRQDRIDILVDLAGHTAHGRLPIFARKPAPIQVTYLGYPDTTGLDAMDYRLTDAFADPPGQTELYHSEQLVRLDPCAWCFEPTQNPPIVPRLEGPLTFGSFNKFAKITEPMLRLWGKILHGIPESRLLLKSASLNTASVRQRVQTLFQDMAIDPRRLDLRGHEPDYGGHLAMYAGVNIALDSFPYHGTTTTCEALWMGVPVVTLAGMSHVSRVGVSLLNQVGLSKLVANTPEEYVRQAVELAGDPPRLARLRSTLRQRMQDSPLMDAPRFARNVEAAYRRMWKAWCEQPGG